MNLLYYFINFIIIYHVIICINCDIIWEEGCFENWPYQKNCYFHSTFESNNTRLIISNAIPDFYFDPYCPFMVNYKDNCDDPYTCGYCHPAEYPNCPFTEENGWKGDIICDYPGDFLTSHVRIWSAPLIPNPTLDDIPRSMYIHPIYNDTEYNSTVMADIGSTINGNSIEGPTEAGGLFVTDAGLMFRCGGHITPPPDNQWHHHRALTCLNDTNIETQHGGLIGYANDGFGIYGFWDINGEKPVVDECGGHFGPTSDNSLDEISYHYHQQSSVPFFLACQGPALGKCESTQHGVNACDDGCGYDICVQPGTNSTSFYNYINSFQMNWIENNNYTINSFDTDTVESALRRSLEINNLKEKIEFIPKPYPFHELYLYGFNKRSKEEEKQFLYNIKKQL